MPMESLVIAGATGFVGHAVAERLAQRFEVTGLTRGRREARGAWTKLVTCDLFSLKDVALDKLSDQHGCGPHSDVVVIPDFGQENAVALNPNATAADTQLNAQLNAVDAQLNKEN